MPSVKQDFAKVGSTGAKGGAIIIQDRNGRGQKHMSPRDAAERANALERMAHKVEHFDNDTRKAHIEMAKEMRARAKEGRAQMERAFNR